MNAEEEFALLLQLPRGWDGREAAPPNTTAVSRARQVEKMLRLHGLTPDRILPSEDGGVGFVLANGSRYADIECFNTGCIGAIMRRGFREPVVWWPRLSTLPSDLERIRAFLFATAAGRDRA